MFEPARKMRCSPNVLTFFLLILLGWPIFAYSADKLAGEPFGDPSAVFQMGMEWEKLPIQYLPEHNKADLVVTLDQYLYPVYLPIIQQFARSNKLQIVTTEGTCGISAGKLARKEVDIGGLCCPPAKTDRLPGLRYHTVGISSVALLVHPDNPINNITLEEARKIFAGEIHRWSELRDSKRDKLQGRLIQSVARLHCKTRPGHWRRLIDNEDLFSPTLREVGAIPDMIAMIADNPTAIGFETMWMAKQYRKQGKVKPLSINGNSPNNLDAIRAGNYPLYRVYSVSTWEDDHTANPLAHRLVKHLSGRMEKIEDMFSIASATQLRKAGWKFVDNELAGEPD